MVGKRLWWLRLTASAEVDLQSILAWTRDRFGIAQARAYAETLTAALDALVNAGPSTAGAKPRDEIAKGLFILHVARLGRKGRHFVLFRVGLEEGTRRQILDVLRILHDAMDLSRNILPGEEFDKW